MTDELELELADPQYDPRTVDELISVALSESDECLAWNAIAALHWRGDRETLHRARQLCQSFCPIERRAGADILGQLGVPDRTFPHDCLRILLGMLDTEQEAEVLYSIFIALSHLGEPAAIAPALPFRHHADANVRYAVVHALTGHADPAAIAGLIELTNDLDSDVRDWATFGLGTQIDIDTPALRDALVARLTDSDDDTRGETMVGLARRGDRRVLPALQRELSAEWVGTLAFEAAEIIAPELLPQLKVV